MNKIQLIQALKDATDLSKPEAEKVVNLFFNEMTGALAKGERVLDMREFFSTETVEAGDAAYHQFDIRFTATKVAAVTLGLCIIAGCAVLITKIIKKRKVRK